MQQTLVVGEVCDLVGRPAITPESCLGACHVPQRRRPGPKPDRLHIAHAARGSPADLAPHDAPSAAFHASREPALAGSWVCFESGERGDRGEGRDHRQPEVDQPINDYREQCRWERDADPAERERKERLDDARAA
jgi:hypothetical protein